MSDDRSPSGARDAALRDELLAMRAEDLRVRTRLAADGSLFEGYHPEMEAVHRANAARLREILDAHGWPGHARVGADGAEAAWLVAQHAIGEPDMQRRCLTLLTDAAERGDVPAWQPAYLEDRVHGFEGRPQRYGTQWDVDAEGRPFPLPIEDPDGVEARRAAVGLEPLAMLLARAEPETPLPPEVRARKKVQEAVWLRRVGWRA